MNDIKEIINSIKVMTKNMEEIYDEINPILEQKNEDLAQKLASLGK